jgi:hypothetical protein
VILFVSNHQNKKFRSELQNINDLKLVEVGYFLKGYWTKKVEVDWYWIFDLLIGYWKNLFGWFYFGFGYDWYLNAINQLLTQRCSHFRCCTRAVLLFFRASVITVNPINTRTYTIV